MTPDTITLTREELYEMVWKEPIQTVATRYHLSDRGLAKACIRLRVPIPGRGFWQKKAAGKELWRPRLPTLLPTSLPQERQFTVRTEAAPTAAATRCWPPTSAPGRTGSSTSSP